MNQPRIVTWRAVSSEEQVDRESLDYQARLNREHVARWRGIVVADLEVPGISRYIILWEKACQEIPAFARLRDLLEKRAFDVLMCLDVTRLARTSSLLATLVALCEQAGVRIYETSSPPSSLDGPIATFDTRLMTLLKGGMSEQEIRKFSERSTFGRKAKVLQGNHANTPPIGYKRLHDNGEILIVVDEDYAPLVAIFYDLYLNHGMGLRLIAAEFNARGYARPRGDGPWQVTHVSAFLRNRWVYAGYVTWGVRSRKSGKQPRVKASWQALITEQMAQEAERELQVRGRAPRAAGTPQRFSLVARCDVCGHTISVHRMRGKRNPQCYYLCPNLCRGSSIRESVMMDAVRKEITRLQGLADVDAVLEKLPDGHAQAQAEHEDAQRKLDNIAKERTRLTMAFMREAITLEEYEPLMASLKERQDKLVQAITSLEEQLAATPSFAARRQNLEDIRTKGLQMLDNPDIRTVNTWLRKYFILYIAHNRVSLIEER